MLSEHLALGLNDGRPIAGREAVMASAAAAGLSSAQLEALQHATVDSARAYGFTDLGVIAPGKLADLVVLSADPLADIRNSDDITHVMVNGRLYNAQTLNEEVTGNRQRQPYFWEDSQSAAAQ